LGAQLTPNAPPLARNNFPSQKKRRSKISGVIVIVAYRPKPGKEQEILELVRDRVPTLRKEGLVTDRVPTMMRTKDGTIIEVSEWKSREAIDAAHKNPNVLAMWNKFFAVCDCVPLKTLAEAEDMFAGFEPIDD
jgi:quinol monooxygenase YgiN